MNAEKIISNVISGSDLSEDEMFQIINAIFEGKISEEKIISFLQALSEKGESVEEIVGAVKSMRKHSIKVNTNLKDLVDCCGTGGLGKNIMNISTCSAFVAAAGGVKIAKHGNRTSTGVSGSADILEAAGVNISIDSEQVSKCLESVGIGFMFAQNHHPGMKYVMPARAKIGKKTIFNLLGPLTNPAGALKQNIGVFDKKWIIPITETLKKLGAERALVFHSEDGLDEISAAKKTYVAELKKNKIIEFEIEPEDFDIENFDINLLKVTSAKDSYEKVMKTLNGSFPAGEEIIKLNAAAIIYTSGLASSIDHGFSIAEKIIHSGRANEKLKALIEISNSFK